MKQYQYVLRQARIKQGDPLTDIAIEGEQIAAIGPSLPDGQQEFNLAGRVVMPGLVDCHVHLDKTLSIGHVQNHSGTLLEAIENWRLYKPGLTRGDYLERGRRAVDMAIANGTLFMRSHVDVDANEHTALEAMLELRESYRGRIELQLVALGWPGVSPEEDRAMLEAMQLGADVVGACPAITPEPEHCLEAALSLADTLDKPVDFHLDEHSDPSQMLLEKLAELTLQRGLSGRVIAGHCCALSFADQGLADRVMEKVAEAGIGIVTLPASNLVLQGRGQHPAPRGLTRVKELHHHRARLALASDNVQDPFQPLGHYDLLGAAQLTALATYMTAHAEMMYTLEMITHEPAQMMGLQDYGLKVGARANLVVLGATTPLEALAQLPPRLAVFKDGQLLRAMAQLETQWTS